MNDSRFMPTFHLGKWIAYTFFFLILFVPLTYQPIKGVFLGLLLGLIIINILAKGKVFLHRSIFRGTIIIIIAGMVFVLVGLIKDTPGVLHVSHLYVLWPIVFVLLITGITDKRIINDLVKVVVFTTIAISLYALIDIATLSGWLPDNFPIRIDKGQGIGFHQGFVHYVTHSVYSLFFAIPFLISALMTWKKSNIVTVSRLWLWMALILSLAMALLSARRALWIMIVLSPVLTVILHKLSHNYQPLSNRNLMRSSFVKLILIVFIVFFSLHFMFDLDYSALIQRLVAGFQFKIDSGAIVRAEQFFALLRGWSESPLIGSGLGAVAEGSIRDPDQPWLYELFYLSLLFQTGIIGIIVYSVAVAWVYRMGFKMIRSGGQLGLYMLPILVGTSSFLIASATNPYLGTFSGVWPIYFPLALINFWLLTGRKITHKSQLPEQLI